MRLVRHNKICLPDPPLLEFKPLGPNMLMVLTLTCVCLLQASPVAAPLMFETDVRPILKVYCLDCHGAEDKLSGNLDLRLVRLAIKGGKHGPAIKLGNPTASSVIERMKSGEMPPGEKKVPEAQVALIERWIKAGAPTRRVEPERLDSGVGITVEERNYWFFKPLVRPAVPLVGPKDRVRTPIDAFVHKRLAAQGLGFAPDADKRTQIIRVALDLTGLPPTDKEIQAFLADSSNEAYEKMVDRYLESPAHGERWARHWLDVFGYADSDGDGTTDTQRPYAYRFRDYVIRSVDSDKPLDRMFLEMVAGDELLPRPLGDLGPAQVELLAATGFLRMGPDSTAAGGEAVLNADQAIADSLKIISASLLGVSVGCAQCHDHKYDPISHADYFRLRAVFNPAWNPAGWKAPGARVVSLMTQQQRQERTKIEAEEREASARREAKAREWIDRVFEQEVGKFPEAQRAPLRDAFKAAADKRTPDQKKLVDTNPKLAISAGVLYQYSPQAVEELKKLDDALAAIRSRKPVETFVAGLVEDPSVTIQTKIHHRGDPRQPTKPVVPGDLTIAAPEGNRFDIPDDDPAIPTTGRRLAWVRHLFKGSHPLTGRVLANRLWLGHFGRGIVDTPGEFGKLGLAPSHPELLDWMATQLASNGWSAKSMHRMILNSTVYRQASKTVQGPDRSNNLYSRFPVQRLEAEVIRDRMLSASGQLDASRFGPAVVTAEDAAGLLNSNSKRRAIYLEVRRSRPETMLSSFDAPGASVNCDRRSQATSAMQALVLMNGDFVRTQSVEMAKRVISEVGTDPSLRIFRAIGLGYCRPPVAEELAMLKKFMADQSELLKNEGFKGDANEAGLTNLCQQILTSNEFLYAP